VRLRAVARISARSNDLTRIHPRPDGDAHRSALEVSDEHKWSRRPHRKDYVIARDRAHPLTHTPMLRQRVLNERQLRAAGLVIRFAVDCDNDRARYGRQDWYSEANK
jgi:hypothetical protein